MSDTQRTPTTEEADKARRAAQKLEQLLSGRQTMAELLRKHQAPVSAAADRPARAAG